MSVFRFLVMVIFLCLQACSTLPDAIIHSAENNNTAPQTHNSSTDNSNKIYVASHGWHTGFIIAAKASESMLPFLQQRFSDSLYYEFGWGDKGFYQAKEITSGLTVQAILWPSESVMHVVAVPMHPRRYFANSEVIELNISDTDLHNLLLFIRSSFHRDKRQQVVTITNGLYGNSQFYQGVGDYHLFNTCNKWVAKGLQSAGYDLSATFKLTAKSVMSYLKYISTTNNTEPKAEETETTNTPAF